jgi:heptosyltransferase I
MKILIIKTSSMGDVIHTLPAVTDAIRAFSEISFDWAVEESFSEIPTWHRGVKKVIPVPLRRGKKHPFDVQWKSFFANLRQEKYDLIIDAQGLLKSALLSCVGQGTRCGYDWHSAREPLASIFYQKKYSIALREHAITRIRKLFSEVLGYSFLESEVDYGISDFFPKKESSEKYLIFIPCTSRKEKLWPESKWRELIVLAQKENWKIKIPSGNQEDFAQMKQLSSGFEKIEILNQLSLREIATEIKNSSGVIAVDTGLAHLAAALSVSTIALYISTDVFLIGTKGKKQIQLISADQVSSENVWREFKLL